MIEVASAHSRTQPQFDILRQVGKGIVQKFVTAKHVSEFTVRDLRYLFLAETGLLVSSPKLWNLASRDE